MQVKTGSLKLQDWVKAWIDKIFAVLIPLATLFGWQKLVDFAELQNETLIVGHAIVVAVMAGKVIVEMIARGINHTRTPNRTNM